MNYKQLIRVSSLFVLLMILSSFSIRNMMSNPSSPDFPPVTTVLDISTNTNQAICTNGTVTLRNRVPDSHRHEWFTTTGVKLQEGGDYVINNLTDTREYILRVYAPEAALGVVNGGFESGNTGFYTEYRLGGDHSRGLWPEGTYRVGRYPRDYHTHFSRSNPHSGNRQMILNGTRNAIVWRQQLNVEANSEYIFSAFGCSVARGNPARLRFEIVRANGTREGLGTIRTLPATLGQWVEFRGEWSSSQNETVNIQVVDEVSAAGGNDFAIDDITFRKVAFVDYRVTIRVQPRLTVAGNETKQICSNGSITMPIVGSVHTYKWYRNNVLINGATSKTYQKSPFSSADNGTYRCVATGDCGEINHTINLTVVDDVNISSTNQEEIVCEGNSYTYNINATGSNLTYTWSKDGGGSIPTTISNQNFIINNMTQSKAGTYRCNVSNSCTSQTIVIQITYGKNIESHIISTN
ncbi:MAG: immunoglobulin domain-containing protein [Marinifilaceae bacterium]|jgi:hypothetical protein|nr:immunoglobulin domain-containing protein [Marinifilaceae bacterium]